MLDTPAGTVKVCSEPVYLKVCVAAVAEDAPTLKANSEKHPMANPSARRVYPDCF